MIYSRFTRVFFLQDKAEVASKFKKFVKKAQNEFQVKIKKIRSDNGKEFDNTNIEDIVMKLGSSMRSLQLILHNKIGHLEETSILYISA